MARILLVDTSATSRVMVMKSLEEDGHRVEETANGRKALEICRQAAPDCIILDLVLQDLDGFKVLRALQEDHPNIPVVVHTDLHMKDLEERCKELGAVAFLRKPVVPLNLREKVNAVVQGVPVSTDTPAEVEDDLGLTVRDMKQAFAARKRRMRGLDKRRKPG